MGGFVSIDWEVAMPTTADYLRALDGMELRDDQKMSSMLRAQLRAPGHTLSVAALEREGGLENGGFDLFYGQWCKELVGRLDGADSLPLDRYRDLIAETRRTDDGSEVALRPEFVAALRQWGFS